jgi:hypothetical protein
MPQKPKARASKSKKESVPRGDGETEKTQAERFIETARAIGVDESGVEFERALATITPSVKVTKR